MHLPTRVMPLPASRRVARLSELQQDRSHEARSIASYVGVGVLSYGVDIGLLALCYSLVGLPLWVSTSVGFWASFAVNFGLNRTLTFRSHAPVGGQLVRYAILVALNYGASVALVGLAEAVGIGYVIGKTGAVAVLVVVNYVAYRLWVFR